MKKMFVIMIGILLVISIFGTSMALAAPETSEPYAFADLMQDEIGMDQAVKIALEDAGLTEQAVEFTEKTNEFSDGRYIYNIDFIIRGEVKYEYDIDGMTGNILEQDKDLWEQEDNTEYSGLTADGQKFFAFATEESFKAIEAAYKTAIEDSKVSEAEIVLHNYGVEYDKGKVVLEVDFFIPGVMKYEYDMDLSTGTITDSDKDSWEAEDNVEYKNLLS